MVRMGDLVALRMTYWDRPTIVYRVTVMKREARTGFEETVLGSRRSQERAGTLMLLQAGGERNAPTWLWER